MNKKESFKEFIKSHPSFVKSVNGGKISWQGLYELFDIYGSENEVFNEYLDEKVEPKKTEHTEESNVKNIFEALKGVNMEEVKKNLNSLEKAVTFLEDFVVPEKKEKEVVENVVNPKPLDNFFDD